MNGWEEAEEIIEQHHERWDGQRYPSGMRGERICVGAQIQFVLDAFESMTRSRPGRLYGRLLLRAVTEIYNCAESQFRPVVVPVFNAIIRERLS